MFLNQSPSTEYFICAKKSSPGEEHIPGIYERSVLILMMKGVLSFLENGEKIVLSAGEYYIQKDRYLQEGPPVDDLPEYIYVEFKGSFSSVHGGLPLRGRYDTGRMIPIAERLADIAKKKSGNKFTLSSYMLRIFGEHSPHTPGTYNTIAYLISCA